MKKAINIITSNNKPQRLSRSKMYKKIVFVVTAVAAIMVMSCLTCFAAVNPSEFISKAQTVLTAVICLIGAGLAVWGIINLLEGYGNDNPGANAHVS